MSDKKLADVELDPALAPTLEAVLPELAAEILAAIGTEVPEYARPLEGSFGRGLRVGVDEALRQFVEQIRAPGSDRDQGRSVYIELGRGEQRQGRSLDSLQAAYRVGARVAWRLLSTAAAEAGHPPAEIYRLADAIFAYIDELSAESVEGFAAARAEREGERGLRRSRLLAALVSGAAPAEVDELATLAGWQPPKTLAAAVAGPDAAAAIARRLGPEALAGVIEETGCVIVADPDGPATTEALDRLAARDVALTIGPSVEPARARISWTEAQAAAAARERGALGPGAAAGVIRTDEHLALLMLGSQSATLERIRRRRLAALDDETPASRARLLDTLAGWLANMGAINETARDLDVHPQTVRYRLARLRELLGPQLDDAEARFEIELALRGGDAASPRTGKKAARTA